jgi:putative SOS response-associated peptidase YedK
MRRDSSLSPVEWNGVRGTKATPVEGRHLLYGFLTTEPSGGGAPIHPKAMPVILTTQEECDVWMRATWESGQAATAPAQHDAQIVASGEREDPAAREGTVTTIIRRTVQPPWLA